MKDDSKLLHALRRRVRVARVSCPSVEVVWFFSPLPVFEIPASGAMIDGVLCRPLYPSHIIAPGR